MIRYRTLLATAALGLALLAASILQARAAGVRGVAPSGPAPRAAPLRRTVAAEGRVMAHPGAEVTLAAERAGRLVSLLVVEGQQVARGQLVAEVESDELRAALAEARARVREAEAEARLAEASLARRRRLVEEKVVSLHELDEARRDLEVAEARIETARAQVERLSAQLGKSRVLAPFAGTVTVRHRDAGETVDTGDPVVTVADLLRLRVEAEADEADAPALRVGARAEVSAQGHGPAVEGAVEEVADSVTVRRLKPQDPSRPTDTRILAVKVALPSGHGLKLGTTVELRIEAEAPGLE